MYLVVILHHRHTFLQGLVFCYFMQETGVFGIRKSLAKELNVNCWPRMMVGVTSSNSLGGDCVGVVAARVLLCTIECQVLMRPNPC